MNTNLRLLLFITVLLGHSDLSAQSSAWLGVRTSTNLNSRWKLDTFTETRYFLNEIRPERAFSELSPSRKLGKYLRLAAPTRFTAFGNAEQRFHEIRLGLQAIVKLKIAKSFNAQYRSFYQWDKSIDGKGFQKSYWRHKVDFQKKWSRKIASQVEQEFWHDFTASGKIDRYRLVLSSTIAVKKTSGIYFGYLTQSPLFHGKSRFENIAVLRYQLKI